MAEICVVVGQGYVGLPVAMQAVAAGFDVVGFDADAVKVKRLNAGDSYVEDVSDDVLRDALGERPVPRRHDARRRRVLRRRGDIRPHAIA